MNLDQAFPSKYLKAVDLNGQDVTFTIDRVKQETIGSDLRLVVCFRGTAKQFVLNKTNASAIARVTGSRDTDDWPGQRVTLYPTETDLRGETVRCVRVRPFPDGGADYQGGYRRPPPVGRLPVTSAQLEEEETVPF
jgi:hypothetical protein